MTNTHWIWTAKWRSHNWNQILMNHLRQNAFCIMCMGASVRMGSDFHSVSESLALRVWLAHLSGTWWKGFKNFQGFLSLSVLLGNANIRAGPTKSAMSGPSLIIWYLMRALFTLLMKCQICVPVIHIMGCSRLNDTIARYNIQIVGRRSISQTTLAPLRQMNS